MPRWSKKREELRKAVISAAIARTKPIPYFATADNGYCDWRREKERVATALEQAVERLEQHIKKYGE